MNEAVQRMLARYERRSFEGQLQALREVLQEIALLGLWRSKFFDKAAFYGGTALRILYGLDRFSEDLDFSLLRPAKDFLLKPYLGAVRKELAAFGFDMRVEQRKKKLENPVHSAFLKAGTRQMLLVIETAERDIQAIHPEQTLKIKLEVDTQPPPAFETRTRYLLQPIPFMVRAYVLPDLFAGKVHALLYRKWKKRVKGRDWYDLVWYATNHPELHLEHLEQRMRQSGDWTNEEALAEGRFRALLDESIKTLNVEQARKEVEPFVRSPDALALWSKGFFREVCARIRLV
jgi:predicted nucleotidyltransferase component of viral defense system